jgi:PAS domain S-box-containing protein
LRDETGKVVSIIPSANVITERKQAEDDLLASRMNLEAALASMSDAVFISDIEGRFSHFNDAFATFHKFRNKEECAKTFAEYPEILDVFMANGELAPLEMWAVPRALRGETATNEEYTLRRKDTGETWVGSYNFAPIRNKVGDIVGSVVTGRDITERKKVETALQESEQKYRLIVDNADNWIYWIAPDGNFHYISPSCERVSGYFMEEFINHPQLIKEIVHAEDRSTFISHSEKIRIEHEPDYLEYRIITKTGDIRWISHTCSPIYTQEGLYAGRRATNRNITERKEAEEELLKYRDHLEEMVKERTSELAEANLHLQELDHLKSMFIASMSHELRTPLNSIIGFTGIILMGMSGEISAVQKKQLVMVKNSANHLLELINDVIDVSKIEAGKTDLSIKAFDLSDLALQVKESFAVAAADKGLNLECRTGGAAEVTSDRRRVRQILVNLVGNAVKFTETGTVAISVAQTGKGVEIKVRDTGIGMDREDMERLFLAFSRIHIQGRPIVEGTGLGLYLSRRIAALLGGEITAESEPGRGSEFTLSLPWKYPEEKE